MWEPEDDERDAPLPQDVDAANDADGANDLADTAYCQACGRELHEDAELCPHCGHWRTQADEPGRRAPVLLIVVVAALVVAFLLWQL